MFNDLGAFIFWSHWLQAPLYVGLIIAQPVYVYHFMVKLALALIDISSIHLLKAFINAL